MRGEWIEMLHRTRAHLQKLSLPMRGEWIEIAHKIGPLKAPVTSLPMRGEWIEISDLFMRFRSKWSLPMRGEWIEIGRAEDQGHQQLVSPHAGRVD